MRISRFLSMPRYSKSSFDLTTPLSLSEKPSISRMADQIETFSNHLIMALIALFLDLTHVRLLGFIFDISMSVSTSDSIFSLKNSFVKFPMASKYPHLYKTTIRSHSQISR
jgi:hypothetical protein